MKYGQGVGPPKWEILLLCSNVKDLKLLKLHEE